MTTQWDHLDPNLRLQFLEAVVSEVERAYAKHGKLQWGRHEFYAILKEEVDEAWDDIKADAPQEKLMQEVVQIAAMCLRYAETGDRYREPEVQCGQPAGDYPVNPQNVNDPDLPQPTKEQLEDL